MYFELFLRASLNVCTPHTKGRSNVAGGLCLCAHTEVWFSERLINDGHHHAACVSLAAQLASLGPTTARTYQDPETVPLLARKISALPSKTKSRLLKDLVKAFDEENGIRALISLKTSMM